MSSVPTPAGQSTSPAARSNAGQTGNPNHFTLPDLCSPLAVFGVVLASQLLALLLTLAGQPGWFAFYSHLSQAALLLLWIGLIAAAILCRLRTWLTRFAVPEGSVVTYSVVMAPLLRYFYVSQQWQRNVRREAESRLNALQARIRPHFLFNSMNTIASLTRSNPVAAEQAVEDLADLFRASLRDGRQLIPLHEELEITRVYERMEQHRLGPRLQVDWQLGTLPATAEIPGLTIQPLLENAIYHGIEPSPQPGIISVSGESDGKLIRIAVTNPLPPAGLTSRPGHGLALDNIRERLELAFGPDGTLAVLAGPDRYTVTVTFPANGVRSYA